MTFILHLNGAVLLKMPGGRAGSQTRVCSFGRCRVVRYTAHPSGTRAGNPTRISSLGPKRHHALDHASLINVEGMQRIEL